MVTHLLSCVGCNITNTNSRHSNFFNIRLTLAICCGLAIGAAVDSAAIYSNVDFLSNPNFEPICSAQQEHFIESDGKESSLILEFNRGTFAENMKSCTRIISAPSNYGFIVRLILPKIRRSHSYSSTTSAETNGGGKPKISAGSALTEMTSLLEKLNTTALGRTCPVSVFSSLDPHTPQWRVDPCQLEDTAPEMEDPVRLFHGRVRIVWENRHNKLNSKLMVTVLGKGEQCRNEKKHPCLKIGDEPILCISKDLVCDGIRHCPYSNEYDSDEDYTMCWKRRRFGEPIPPAMESDIFEHFALEVFRNLFISDVSNPSDETTTAADISTSAAAYPSEISSMGANSTTLRKVDVKHVDASGNRTSNVSDTTATPQLENSTIGGHHRRNSTRFGLNSDLSKYGPWGYLMLGMLLCGGALLICGLWASASQHATNNEREAALHNAAMGSGAEHPSGAAAPPNYDELDPPPAYSVLFPNQKAASSNTLSSLAAAVAPPASVAATAALASGTTAPHATTPTVHATQTDDAMASGSQVSN